MMDSFRPEYTNGKISQSECEALLNEINSSEGVQRKSCWDVQCLLIFLAFAAMASCAPLYGVNCSKFYKDRGTVDIFKTTYSSEESQEMSANLGMGLGIILGLGFISIITMCCLKSAKEMKSYTTRNQIIGAIINKQWDYN